MRRHDSELLVASLLSGNEQTAYEIVDRYFPELTRLASRHLKGVSIRSTAPEDVVQSAFGRFFERAKNGKYPNLDNRSDLLKLLRKITRDRAIDLVRQHHSQKHGGGNVRGESALFAQYGECGINQAADSSIDPNGQMVLRCEFEMLLQQLDDEKLIEIALLKFGGHSNEEISEQMGCSKRTVERRVGLIRKIWEKNKVAT